MSFATAEFGPLVTNVDIDEAIIGVLATYTRTYLAQVERDRGIRAGALPVPARASFANTLTDPEFLDHRLPAVIVTTAETRGNPVRGADGSYAAEYNVTVSSVVRGRKPPEARRNGALFEACVRRVMLQMVPQAQSVVCEVRWMGSNVAPITTNDGRYLVAGIGRYIVYVDRAVSDMGGPVSYIPSTDAAAPPTIFSPAATLLVPTGLPAAPQTDPFDPAPLVGSVSIVGPTPKE